MLASTLGSLTIVDVNQPVPKYFWRGVQLPHVLTFMANVRDQHKRVALRVLAPSKVVPALTQAQQDELVALHAEMSTSGIEISVAQGA